MVNLQTTCPLNVPTEGCLKPGISAQNTEVRLGQVRLGQVRLGQVRLGFALQQATRAQRGSRGIALLFHDLGTRWRWVVSVTPQQPLPPGKTRQPLYRRLVGTQGRYGQMQKISPPTGIRSPDRPARSESLYRLSYPDPQNIEVTQKNIRNATGKKKILIKYKN